MALCHSHSVNRADQSLDSVFKLSGDGTGGGSGSVSAAGPGSLITLISYTRLANQLIHLAGKHSNLTEILYTTCVAHLTSCLY